MGGADERTVVEAASHCHRTDDTEREPLYTLFPVCVFSLTFVGLLLSLVQLRTNSYILAKIMLKKTCNE